MLLRIIAISREYSRLHALVWGALSCTTSGFILTFSINILWSIQNMMRGLVYSLHKNVKVLVGIFFQRISLSDAHSRWRHYEVITMTTIATQNAIMSSMWMYRNVSFLITCKRNEIYRVSCVLVSIQFQKYFCSRVLLSFKD